MKITIHPFNAVFNKIETDFAIEQELYDYFTFSVPNFEFMKRKNPKLKYWDGKVHLYSKRSKKLYVGLNSRLEAFTRDRSYEIIHSNQGDQELSIHECLNFIRILNLSEDKFPRDYQIDAFVKAVRKKRLLILSPTGSGKSLLLYLLVRYYHDKRILLIVPTINLVMQMYTDFQEYGYDVENQVQQIYGGQDQKITKHCTISTWQSIYDQPEEYFDQFGVVLCDEVHLGSATSIKGIMEKLTDCHIRIGCTGTLQDSITNRLVLEGLFGDVFEATTTRQLIDQNHLSDLKIKAIILKYDDIAAKIVKKLDYAGEINYLSQHQRRNNFLKNLTLSLKGNILVLYRLVELHGKPLYDLIKTSTIQNVYLIHGEIDGDEREGIRRIVHQQNNAIIIASYGTYSTGVNIPSIENIIFASPYKSRIKVLQSIGRGLRLNEDKVNCTVFDIADDLSYKKKFNITLNHFIERVKIYAEQNFEYRIYKVDLT